MLVGCVSFLNGCAIMSKTECLGAGDYSRWTILGQNDGLEGKAPQIDKRDQACAKHNVTIDSESYKVGYRKGLAVYCKPQNIFNLALQGKGQGQGSWLLQNGGSYTNCPLELQSELSSYYSVGYNYYQAKSQLEKLEKGIASARSSLKESSLKSEQREYYHGIISENTELLPSAKSSYEGARRELAQFKKQNGMN